jgi:hypothetical protein
MGFDDIISFDEGGYATRIRGWPLSKLQTEQVSMTRQQMSASSKIGVGAGAAPVTFGISLIASAYGTRQLYLGTTKLKLIRAELDREAKGYTRTYTRPSSATRPLNSTGKAKTNTSSSSARLH